MIQTDIRKLAQYGVKTGLVPEEDRIYTINRLLELFELDELEEISGEQAAEIAETETEELEQILGRLLDYAYEKGILKENGVVYRDLFDTRIMSLLMPRPGSGEMASVTFKALADVRPGEELPDGKIWLIGPGFDVTGEEQG